MDVASVCRSRIRGSVVDDGRSHRLPHILCMVAIVPQVDLAMGFQPAKVRADGIWQAAQGLLARGCTHRAAWQLWHMRHAKAVVSYLKVDAVE